MNNYVCLGNLTRDPETHTFSSGSKVVRFGVAVNGRIKKQNGENVKDEQGRDVREVVFWDCEAWGIQADLLEQYAKKGEKLILNGEIKEETWEDKNTQQNRSKKVLRVEKFNFVGGPKESNQDDKPKGKGRPKKDKQEKVVVGTVDEVQVDDPNSITF